MNINDSEMEVLKIALKYFISHGNITSDEDVNKRNIKIACDTYNLIISYPSQIEAENIRVIYIALNQYLNSMQKSIFPVNAELLEIAEDLLFQFEEMVDEIMKNYK